MLLSLLRVNALASVLLLLISSCQSTPLLAAEETLSSEEKETLQQAKDPEQQLKLWLGIAEGRLKDIVAAYAKIRQGQQCQGRQWLSHRCHLGRRLCRQGASREKLQEASDQSPQGHEEI